MQVLPWTLCGFSADWCLSSRGEGVLAVLPVSSELCPHGPHKRSGKRLLNALLLFLRQGLCVALAGLELRDPSAGIVPVLDSMLGGAFLSFPLIFP